MKVFIVGGCALTGRMFERREHTLVAEVGEADLLVFTGGADVDPSFYGDTKHPAAHCQIERDKQEMAYFRKYEDTPKVGICRGGQFLNVMSGGSMWQDVNNHAIGGTHKIGYFADDYYAVGRGGEDAYLRAPMEIHEVTSTHHQMMLPAAHGRLWGFCQRSTYRDRGADRRKASDFGHMPDVEIVYYDDDSSLCFQPHPEYGVKSCEDLFFRCINRAFGF